MSGETLINWMMVRGIEISVLIVIVLLCRRRCAKWFGTRAAYTLWALPVLRLILPDFHLTLPWPSWLSHPSALPTPILTQPQAAIFPAPILSTEAQSPQIYVWLIVTWLMVAVLWFTVLLLKQTTYMRRVLGTAQPATKTLQTSLHKAGAALHMKILPALYTSTDNIGPLVSGLLHPVIILPEGFERHFTQRQQFYALTHELAHIRRRDIWITLLGLAFKAINWPNPLVHYAFHKFRIDQEAACDAYVLSTLGSSDQTRTTYAQTLVRSATISRTLTAQMQAQSPLCLSIYHPLKERLMHLKISKTKPAWIARLGVSTLFGAALLATSHITFARNNTPANKKQTITKSVMKWVEINDGVTTTKHIEVETVNGVTRAYSIDENGNRTEINPEEVKTMQSAGASKGMKIIMLGAGKDAKPGEQIIVNMDDSDIPKDSDLVNLIDGDQNIIMIKSTSDTDIAGVDALTSDRNIFVMNNGSSASAMVEAAERLLIQVGNDDTDTQFNAKTRKKLDRARKALAEAKAALEADQ